jgi:predicted ATPase/DNA-binding SARP family transcriptional activator
VVEIRLFGEFELSADGARLKFGAPAKALELLALLLVRRTALDRQQTAELLWPDKDLEAGRAELRRHLYYLATRALPAGVEWIEGDKRTIRWNPAAPAFIDVRGFEDAATDDPAAALALYRGDLLPALEADWLTGERARLRERAIVCASQLARAALDARAYDDALRYAGHVARIDPWNEESVRIVMAARRANGDTAGAAHAYRDFSRRLADELGVEPSAPTREAYEALVERPRARRPVGERLSSFVGRDADLRDLAALVDRAPIVTIVGPGGVGKTRLAQELLRTTFAQSALRVAFVKLSPISTPDLVLETIALDLGVRAEPGIDLGEAVAADVDRRETLLVVDNCEHVLDETAGVLERLASLSPRLRVLATSREPLMIEGEHLFRVEPLGRSAAIELFTDRARAAGARDALAPESAGLVATICQRLDGLPLAIELAAVQTFDSTISAIAKSLETGFRHSGRRTAEERQRSLRALIDWSVDRLDDDQRAAFAALGILPGLFTAETAAAVAGGPAALDVLVAKSLVVREGERYSLLETTRTHARHRLETEYDAKRVRLRHVERALGIAREAQAAFRTGMRPAWREPIMAELDHIRAALDWAFDHREARLTAIEIAAELDMLWWDASLTVEGLRWIERALEALPPNADPWLRARCWLAAAWIAPDGQRRIDYAARAIGMVYDFKTDAERARAHLIFAFSAQYLEEQPIMETALEVAARYALRADDTFSMALIRQLQGDVLSRAQNFAAAEEVYADAVARYRALGDERGTAMVLANLAENAFRRNELEDATNFVSQAIDIMRERNERRFIAPILANISMYAIAAGNAERAHEPTGEGFALANELDLPMERALFVSVYALLAEAAGDLGYAVELLACSDRLYREGTFIRDNTEATMMGALMQRLRAAVPPPEFAQRVALGEGADPVALVARGPLTARGAT